MSEEKKTVAEESQTSERRSFIRGSALTAGALAASGLAGSASAASFSEDYQASRVERKTLDVAFNSSEVSVYDVNHVLEQILDFCGCPACGFNGYDIRLRVDPILRFKSETPAFATVR